MKKLIFVLIAALGMSCTSYAQMTEKELKKAIKTAQKVVKDARDEMDRDDVPDKRNAKRLIDQAIKDPLLQDWDQTWTEAARIYEYFYNDENVKSYNGRYDTVGMYNYLNDWFTYALRADSLQQIPNAKGKTSNEARKNLIPSVYRNLNSLINGGVFYFNHREDYVTAYKFFDRYFTMAQSELFAADMEEDPTWQQYRYNFAYFPALAAYNTENWENALKYALMAQNDEEYGEDATEFVCECYGNMGDSVKWLESLKAGLIKYPTKDYYYSKLLNYYNLKNDMPAMEAFVKEMIEVDPEKAYNYYVLGYIAQQAKEYDKAIEQYKIAIEKNETLSDAYNNLGLCIMSQASDYMESKSNLDYRSAAYKKALQEQEAYFKSALPYFVKLRELEPDAVGKWGVPLQTLYYMLKMSKELNEVEARMKEKGML